jgi:hypothetical protein
VDQVITEPQAEAIATRLLGRPPDDPDRPWGLEEFAHGWLIREDPASGELFVGPESLVVERETGRVRRFPASVSAERISTAYPAVRDQGDEDRRDT